MNPKDTNLLLFSSYIPFHPFHPSSSMVIGVNGSCTLTTANFDSFGSVASSISKHSTTLDPSLATSTTAFSQVASQSHQSHQSHHQHPQPSTQTSSPLIEHPPPLQRIVHHVRGGAGSASNQSSYRSATLSVASSSGAPYGSQPTTIGDLLNDEPFDLLTTMYQPSGSQIAHHHQHSMSGADHQSSQLAHPVHHLDQLAHSIHHPVTSSSLNSSFSLNIGQHSHHQHLLDQAGHPIHSLNSQFGDHLHDGSLNAPELSYDFSRLISSSSNSLSNSLSGGQRSSAKRKCAQDDLMNSSSLNNSSLNHSSLNSSSLNHANSSLNGSPLNSTSLNNSSLTNSSLNSSSLNGASKANKPSPLTGPSSQVSFDSSPKKPPNQAGQTKRSEHPNKQPGDLQSCVNQQQQSSNLISNFLNGQCSPADEFQPQQQGQANQHQTGNRPNNNDEQRLNSHGSGLLAIAGSLTNNAGNHLSEHSNSEKRAANTPLSSLINSNSLQHQQQAYSSRQHQGGLKLIPGQIHIKTEPDEHQRDFTSASENSLYSPLPNSNDLTGYQSPTAHNLLFGQVLNGKVLPLFFNYQNLCTVCIGMHCTRCA